MRQSVPPAGKSMGKGYQRGAEVVEVEDWTRTCRCLFADIFCVMSCLEGKTSCIKTHKGERFSPTEERTYFVPAKPYKSKKMAFTYPSIAHSHIPDDLMPEFSKKKTSKEWKALILSTEAAWEVEQAAILEGNDSDTTESGGGDDISVLPELPPYVALEPMIVPDAVFVHNVDDIEENMTKALVSTQDALKAAVTTLQELAESLPNVGTLTAEYICPVLTSIIDKINEHSDLIGDLFMENAEALLSGGNGNEDSESVRSLQEKVRILITDDQELEDTKTTKEEVADAVVDSAIVIGEQVANIINIIATLEETPTLGTSLPSLRPSLGHAHVYAAY